MTENVNTDTGAAATSGDAAGVTNTPVETFADVYNESPNVDADAGAEDQGQGGDGSEDVSEKSSDGQKPDDVKADESKDNKAKDEKSKEGDGANDEGEDQDGKGDDDDASEIEYADFEVPDGMELDQALLDKALPIFKEHKLPQEAAQQIVDLGAEMMSKVALEAAEKHKGVVDGWEKDTLSQFGEGGDAKFEERKATAQIGVEKMFSPQERQYITAWGIGNMPGFFATMEQIGLAIKEDSSFSSGAGSTDKEETVADIWYPSKS